MTAETAFLIVKGYAVFGVTIMFIVIGFNIFLFTILKEL